MSNISIIEGEWQNAKQFAKRALDVDTNFVPSYGTLSTVYQHFGKIDQAREVLLKILDIEPNNADAIKILETFAD
jgi:Tfp pilus assembly protein PilF